MVYRSTEGVKDLTTQEDYINSVGTKTSYSKFAQEVDEFAFINTLDRSLDESTATGLITKAEAIYMLVNQNFAEKLDEVTGRERIYSDIKNGGDIATKLGFREKDKGTDSLIAKDKWKSYTMAFMMQYPDKGVQEDLYKAMVVASNLGLIEGNECNWDEPITKEETIKLIIDVQLAKNIEYGYLSEVEYGEINVDKFKIAKDTSVALGVDAETGLEYGEGWAEIPETMVPIDPNEKLPSGMTYGELKYLIDYTEQSGREMGYSEEDINGIVDSLLEPHGVTRETLKRIVVGEPVVTGAEQEQVYEEPSQPVYEEPAYEEPAPVYEEPVYQEPAQPVYQEPAPVRQEPTEWDKDGNGINDAFDENIQDGEGSSESNPNFQLFTP